ncbi:MAG TPA: TonB-dependent receptor [Gemmatimonadales bacterium]|nr:TonB-dependent receptor [Gemmatimonadales bacterium]
MIRGVVLALALALPAARAAAQQPAREPDLADLDIEELGRIRITSTARRPEPASRAAAAVYVITREDIRRSGAVSLPEALRLAPGLQVAQVTGRDWSITSRGFAEQSPNKLLVLIDGRAVYSPLFAGVFWDVQDVPLEDIERIEVILGPGATLWGSNAVNGVINVITRSATDTRSGLVSAHAGTSDHVRATGRWGTALGARSSVRAYGTFLERSASHLADGDLGEDDWQQGQGGARLDLAPGERDQVTVQGDVYTGSGGQLVQRAQLSPPYTETVDDQLDAGGGNLLARWSRRLGERSEVQLQGYYDRAVRKVPSSFGRVAVDIADLELQHHLLVGTRHDLIWGAGYRLNADTISGTFPTTLDPPARTTHLLTGFVQDEIALSPDHWSVTVGTKLEHNDFTGIEVQPNLRLLWLPRPGHTAWTAVSRAVRIPSRLDADVEFVASVLPVTTPPTVVRFQGNEDFDAEEAITWEGGWRAQVSPTVSADLALYYAWYDRLRSITPLPPTAEGGFIVQPFQVDNDARGHTYGGTLTATWHPYPVLRLLATYTLLRMTVEPRDDAPPGSVPNVTPGFNPENQAGLRGSLTLANGLEADLAFRYVDVLPGPQPIPSYVEADARLGWVLRPGLILGLAGRDLLHDQHPEFFSSPQRYIQRRAELQAEWRF